MKIRIKCKSCLAINVFSKRPKLKKLIRRYYDKHCNAPKCHCIDGCFTLEEGESLQDVMNEKSLTIDRVSLSDTKEISYINCNMCKEEIIIKSVDMVKKVK